MVSDDFQQAVLVILSEIPKGKVTTYGALANIAGYPGYSRHVGRVLKNLPKKTNLPWFRVINSQGKSSFPDGSDNQLLQYKKLEAEGVDIKNGKISLRIFGHWQK